MIVARLASGLGKAITGLVLGLVYVVALAFSPLRMGRLLQTVSLPRLRQHHLRTSLTVFGVTVGVAVLMAVTIVNRSILSGVNATVEDVAGKTDLQVNSGTSGFDESLLEKVRAVPGVMHATPVLQQTSRIRDAQGAGERLLLLGIDMLGEEDKYFRQYDSRELEEIRTDPLMFLNSPTNVIISRSLAQRHGYQLHDKIPLMTPSGVRNFDIWGFVENEGAGKAFGGAVAVMYYTAMQVAFDRASNIDRVDVAVARGSSIENVSAALQASLGSSFVVERPSRKGARVEGMLSSIRLGLTNASLIAVLVGAFLIHNTMAISVVQRKRELGILRALGTTRSQLLWLVTLEGVLLGAVGSVLGILVGVVLSRFALGAATSALTESYLQLAATDVHVDGMMIAMCFALGVIGAMLASILAARRAGRIQPASSLRTGTLVTTSAATSWFGRGDALAIALLVLSVALLPREGNSAATLRGGIAVIGLLAAGALLIPRWIQLLVRVLAPVLRVGGLEMQLAGDNLPRDLGRTAATAGALMVGVAMATGFGTYINSFVSSLDTWIHQALPGDLFITSSASLSGGSMRNIPIEAALGDELRKIPEIDYLRQVRVIEMPFQGDTIKLAASEVDLYVRQAHLMLIEGEQNDVLAATKRGAVIVSENFARRFGVHRGGRVVLSGTDGPHAFEVAGVATDYTSDRGMVMMDRATYVEVWNDTRVDTYEIHLRKGASTDAVRALINQRFGEKYDLFVLTNGEFRAEITRIIGQVFALLRSLELVAIGAAALGIVNSLLANVLDRTRELGVLRAIGMVRRQTRRLVMWEAALIGAFGASAGLLVGLAVGYAILAAVNEGETGWRLAYQVSLASGVLPLLMIPVAAFAGWYPAQIAARLKVTEALGFE